MLSSSVGLHRLAVLFDYVLDVLLVSRPGCLVDGFFEFFIVEQVLIAAVPTDIAVHVVILSLLEVVWVDFDAPLAGLVLLPQLDLPEAGCRGKAATGHLQVCAAGFEGFHDLPTVGEHVRALVELLVIYVVVLLFIV